MSNPWFRMYSEFATDPVVQSLAFEDQRHYLIILCLKCNGILDRKLTESNRKRIILRALGLDEQASEEAKRRLMEVEFIDATWQPTTWDKRQFKSDNSTERSRKSRNNNKSGNGDGTNSYVSVSVSDFDISNIKSLRKNIPPPVEFVAWYCDLRNNNVIAQRFVDHYESNGWMVGRTKMKDWQAAIRNNWENNNGNTDRETSGKSGNVVFDHCSQTQRD